MKILLIRLSAVGDVVRTLPALGCLRRAFPEAHIDWAVEEASRPILQDQPDLDSLIIFPRRRISRAFLHPSDAGVARDALRTFLTNLREPRYDLVIDFQGTLKTALMARATRATRRVGLGRGHAREMAHLFYSEPVPLPRRRMNRVDRALALVAHVGADIREASSGIPERPEDAAHVEEFLRRQAPPGTPVHPAIIFPGTSRVQAYKRYPPAHFAAVADRLQDEGIAPVILAWGPGEETIASQVVSHARAPVVLAPPLTLGQLVALIRRARVFIAADTGPMHLAWTVGTPVVAVLGPTDPELNRPGGRFSDVAYRKVYCSPCRNRGCIARTCLEELPPETVATTALRLLAEAEAASEAGTP